MLPAKNGLFRAKFSLLFQSCQEKDLWRPKEGSEVPHSVALTLTHPPHPCSQSPKGSFSASQLQRFDLQRWPTHVSSNFRASSGGKQVTGLFTDGRVPCCNFSRSKRKVMLSALQNYPRDFYQSLYEIQSKSRENNAERMILKSHECS